MTFFNLSVYIIYVKQKTATKMKQTIIIRSLRVALVLAIFCASLYLTVFKAWGFVFLLLVSVFFLDASDSMLVWRLKRITKSHMRNGFLYAYLAVTLIAICVCAYSIAYRVEPVVLDPHTLAWIVYPALITIFSFRYFVIVARVMARYMDTDEEN